jgi:HAD superfamily hydrolase (TIGR01458 family)
MAILFDLDGVFYKGDQALPAAAETAAWVREAGIPHLFLTNTTSRPRSALVLKLARLGIHTDPSHILTPAVAAAAWCRQHLAGRGVALFVPQATRAEFAELPQAENADQVAAVIIGDLGEAWDFATLNRAFRYLMATPQPRLIALGMTRYWQSPDGLRLDVAPFVMALSHASGAEPLVTGKPAPAFFQTALDMLGVGAADTVMIGDDIRGDIEGAQGAGLRAVLMRTGKFRDADLSLGIRPDGVLGSLAELPAWYREAGFAE